MSRYHLNFGRMAEFLLIAAAFLFSLRTGGLLPMPFFRLADVLLVLSVASALLSQEFRSAIRSYLVKLYPYWKWLVVVAIFIIAGQLFSFLRFGANPLSHDVLKDYARLILNLGVFSFAAIMVYKNPRVLRPISIAIVTSLAPTLLVYFETDQAVYFSGSRLSGSMKSSIVFGTWVSMAFIFCVGLIVSKARVWKKIILGAWMAVIASFLMWSGARTAWLSVLLAIILFTIIFWKQKEWGKLKLFFGVVTIAFIAGYFLIGNNRAYNVPRGQMQMYLKSRAIEMVTSPKPYYENRVNSWLEDTSKIYRFPFGFGFMDLSVKDKYPGFVSTFLEITVYGGIFALAAFLMFLAKLVGGATSQIKSALADKSQYLKIPWLVAGAALLVNIIPFNFFQVRILWFGLGVIAGIILQEKQA